MCITPAAIRSITSYKAFTYHTASCYPLLQHIPTLTAFLYPFFGQMFAFPNKALCYSHLPCLFSNHTSGIHWRPWSILGEKDDDGDAAFQNAQFPFLSFKIKLMLLACEKVRYVMESIKGQWSSVSTLVPLNTTLGDLLLSHHVVWFILS